MSWTLNNPVTIGQATKKSAYDALWDNCDTFKVEHDTSGGHTKAITSLTASLPVFTDASKILVSKTIAQTLTALGLTNPVVQVVNTIVTAKSSGSTVLPYDDSIPQNNEGDEVMTLAITPKSVTNKLKIDVCIGACGANAGAATISVALFQDTTANALAAVCNTQTTGNGTNQINLTYYMAAGTTSATTFKVRIGPDSAVLCTFNGHTDGRIFGGVMASSITITEFLA